MKESTTLNLTGGWEQIVNDQERQERIAAFHDKCLQVDVEKLSSKALAFAIGASVACFLGMLDFLVIWLAAPVALAMAGVSCFLFGRVHELKK